MLRWLGQVLGRTEPTECAQAVLLLEENWHYKPVLELQHELPAKVLQRCKSAYHGSRRKVTTDDHCQLKSSRSAGPQIHRKLSHDQLTYLMTSGEALDGTPGLCLDGLPQHQLDAMLLSHHQNPDQQQQAYYHYPTEATWDRSGFSEPHATTGCAPTMNVAPQQKAGPVPTLRSALPKSQMGSMIFNMSMSATTLCVLDDSNLSRHRDDLLRQQSGPTPARTIARQQTTGEQRPKNSLPIDELMAMLRHQARKKGSPAATTPKTQDGSASTSTVPAPAAHPQQQQQPSAADQICSSTPEPACSSADLAGCGRNSVHPAPPSSQSSCKELSFVGVYGGRGPREASPTPSIPVRIVGFEVKPCTSIH